MCASPTALKMMFNPQLQTVVNSATELVKTIFNSVLQYEDRDKRKLSQKFWDTDFTPSESDVLRKPPTYYPGRFDSLCKIDANIDEYMSLQTLVNDMERVLHMGKDHAERIGDAQMKTDAHILLALVAGQARTFGGNQFKDVYKGQDSRRLGTNFGSTKPRAPILSPLDRDLKNERFTNMKPGDPVVICNNHRAGHHDVTGRKGYLNNKKAVVLASADWPNTWYSLRMCDTGEKVKVRSSNIVPLQYFQTKKLHVYPGSSDEQGFPEAKQGPEHMFDSVFKADSPMPQSKAIPKSTGDNKGEFCCPTCNFPFKFQSSRDAHAQKFAESGLSAEEHKSSMAQAVELAVNSTSRGNSINRKKNRPDSVGSECSPTDVAQANSLHHREDMQPRASRRGARKLTKIRGIPKTSRYDTPPALDLWIPGRDNLNRATGSIPVLNTNLGFRGWPYQR